MSARFLTRADVAEELNVSLAQVYALIRRGELRAAKIGGRGDYRIGRDDLGSYIERAYAETERWLTRPLARSLRPGLRPVLRRWPSYATDALPSVGGPMSSYRGGASPPTGNA